MENEKKAPTTIEEVRASLQLVQLGDDFLKLYRIVFTEDTTYRMFEAYQEQLDGLDDLFKIINKPLIEIIAKMPKQELEKKTLKEKYKEWMNTPHPKLYKFSFIFCIICFIIEVLCLIAVCIIKLFKK